MPEELSLSNILGTDEIDSLFSESDSNISDTTQDVQPDKEGLEVNEPNKTTEVDADTLFDSPESVGSGKETIGNQEDTSSEQGEQSPNLFSSIAKALKDEGVFPDIEDSEVSKILKPEDFRALIDQQIKAGLDERQRRIDEALDLNVDSSEIKKYENTLSYLNQIDEASITADDAKGEELRKQLLYQDFINRNFSKERAQREVQKSLNAGSDIEDAKEALMSNKEFFQNQYDRIIEQAKAEESRTLKEREESINKLKTSILTDSKIFGEIEVDKTTRQKVFDNIAKPIHKDTNGNYLTALQKYEADNKIDFLKNIGLIFTLTDGFKNLDGLVKGKVKQEINKGLRSLERTLNSTARTPEGNLNFASGVGEDAQSIISKGYKLDL